MILKYRERNPKNGKRMTQAELARLLGVTQKSVSELERGILPVTQRIAQRLHEIDPEHSFPVRQKEAILMSPLAHLLI